MATGSLPKLRLDLATGALLLCGFSPLVSTEASSLELSVRTGNIFIEDGGKSRQLTNIGQDSDAVLSSDRKFVVFTRGNSETGCKVELRRIGINGSQDERLVSAHASDEPQQNLCAFEGKQFSSDGRLLFFLSPAWTTSSALHVYDFAKRTTRYVAPANDAIVLNFCTDEHRDQLVLAQHRYFIGGGSYDWYWLYDRTGQKQIGPVGDDSENRKTIIAKAKDMICPQ